MPGIKIPTLSTVRVRQEMRRIENDQPVKGFDGNVAAGRTVLVIGKNVFGGHEIKASTRTDQSGNFSFSLAAGANDRFIVMAIGDNLHEEHTRALGDITGVV